MNIRRTVFDARIVRGHTRRTTRSIPHTPPDRRRVTDGRSCHVCVPQPRPRCADITPGLTTACTRRPTGLPHPTVLPPRLRSDRYDRSLTRYTGPADRQTTHSRHRSPARRHADSSFRVLDRTRREERHQVYSKRTHKLVADPHDIQQRPEPVGRGSLDVRPRSEGFTC
jgi:hypothetical protein